MDLICGDCTVELIKIPDDSIDMVCCDMPYGLTSNWWDTALPLGFIWRELTRIVKSNCAIVLHATQPFTTTLMASNMGMWRHNWQWNKNNSAGFATVNIRPFQVVEDICVFGKGKVKYYPQMIKGKLRKKGGYTSSDNYGIIPTKTMSDMYYPKSLINISNASQKGKIHSTQKPVALSEYLIKTYTDEGNMVLDFCMGSGTTGVGCLNLKRNFIGIEKDKKYFKAAKKRIEKVKQNIFFK